jgi:hypothetical protein
VQFQALGEAYTVLQKHHDGTSTPEFGGPGGGGGFGGGFPGGMFYSPGSRFFFSFGGRGPGRGRNYDMDDIDDSDDEYYYSDDDDPGLDFFQYVLQTLLFLFIYAKLPVNLGFYLKK